MMDIEVLETLVRQLLRNCSLEPLTINGKQSWVLKVKTHDNNGFPGGLWDYVNPQDPDSFQWALSALQNYLDMPDKSGVNRKIRERKVERFGRP